VWGTGYIGFSTMANFAAEGVVCVGTDVSERIVSTINSGKTPVPNMEYWLGFDPKYLVDSGMMSATLDWEKLVTSEFAVHMIAIPTEKEDKPWDGALADVTSKISSNAPKSGRPPLVIIESTLTPNKTDQLVIPIFEKNGITVGKDVFLGVAPRRDWFISPEKNLRSLPRIVGGTTPEATKLMTEVLGIVCDRLVPAPDHRHAEIVKSVENAYRHMDITLANQLSLAYPNLNMIEVLKLVGTKWNVNTYHPSFGSGGYCLGADEYVLATHDGNVRFEPVRDLYEKTKSKLDGEVKVLSFAPSERRVSFRRVTAMSRRVSPTLSLKTVGGHELAVTPEHIMYVRKRRLWKRFAKDLQRGEEIAFIDRLPYFKFYVENPEYVRRGRVRRGRVGHVIDLQYFAKGIEHKMKIGTGEQRLSTGLGKSYQTVPRLVKIEPRLGFLLGLYAAEGCVTRDSGSLRTYISLNRDETELIKNAKTVLDSYRLQYTDYNDKSTKTHQIRVSGEIWGKFIVEMAGGASDRAKLPEFLVLWHDTKVRKALLSGVLNGDGSVSRTGSVEFYTKSKVLQQQVIYLLRSVGLTPTLNTSRDPPSVRIAGKQAREFAKTIFVGRKLDRLLSYAESTKNRKRQFSHEESRRPLLKSSKPNGTEVVYSLEVEKTQNFFTTSGWLVHNCIPLSSKYVLEGAEKPEYLTLLKDTVATDSRLPEIVADRIAERGLKNVGILGLSYKGDLKVHVLSPTLRISRRLAEQRVKVKINDPYYTLDEIKRLTGAESFSFPEGLSEFDCVVIVAGHRSYKAVPEVRLKSYLKNCKLVLDNLEEIWRTFDLHSAGIEYHVAGDKNWLG
jgi:UDP-N-acetyl-D-mannosaminuronate dehydrogenase